MGAKQEVATNNLPLKWHAGRSISGKSACYTHIALLTYSHGYLPVGMRGVQTQQTDICEWGTQAPALSTQIKLLI